MTEQPKMYTLQEVADILRVSRQTIYNYIHNGRLICTKYGKEYRLTEKQLQEFLRKGHS